MTAEPVNVHVVDCETGEAEYRVATELEHREILVAQLEHAKRVEEATAAGATLTLEERVASLERRAGGR